MNDEDKRIVKIRVRVNASGKRVIGYVDLPSTYDRISDTLNGADNCLLVREEKAGEDAESVHGRIVFKEAISYVEALEEPKHVVSLRQNGELRSFTAELKEPNVQLGAEIFVPDMETILDVLSDSRPFINLLNVQFIDSVERYKYLAVAKSQVIMLTL